MAELNTWLARDSLIVLRELVAFDNMQFGATDTGICNLNQHIVRLDDPGGRDVLYTNIKDAMEKGSLHQRP
jgi:hypothetical protein